MCGRYFINPDESDEIREIVTTINNNNPNQPVKLGEIFPTNNAPILYGQDGMLVPQAAVWGFPGFKGSNVIINARAETVAEKRTFRDSLLHRRCVVPTTGFYEWSQTGKKVKYLFRLPDTPTLYLAGIFNDFDGLRRFVILTSAANDSISNIHDRMPVLLTPELKQSWVEDKELALNYLHAELPMLVRAQA